MPDSIGGIVATQQPTTLHGSVDQAMSAFGGMDSDGFLKLLVAQLQYQNPMEPQDSSDLMMQTSTLAQLDATQQLLKLQQEELGMQQAVTAAGLLGTDVTAFRADGSEVRGTVDAVRYTTAGPILSVAGEEVTLGGISELRAPSALPPAVPAAAVPAAAVPAAAVPAAAVPAAAVPAAAVPVA